MKSIDEIYGTIIEYIHKEKPEIAIRYCNRILKALPDDDTALLFKGEALIKMQKYDESIEIFDKLLETLSDEDEQEYYPNLFELLKFKAESLICKNQYEKAIECYDRLLSIKKDDDFVLLLKAELFELMADYDKAFEYYDKTIETNPESYYAYLEKAQLYKKLEKYDEAIKYFDKVIKIDPNNIEAYLGKADILKDNKENYKEALKCYDKLITLTEEDDFSCYIEKGIILLKLNRKKEAIKSLKRYFKSILDLEIKLMYAINNIPITNYVEKKKEKENKTKENMVDNKKEKEDFNEEVEKITDNSGKKYMLNWKMENEKWEEAEAIDFIEANLLDKLKENNIDPHEIYPDDLDEKMKEIIKLRKKVKNIIISQKT